MMMMTKAWMIIIIIIIIMMFIMMMMMMMMMMMFIKMMLKEGGERLPSVRLVPFLLEHYSKYFFTLKQHISLSTSITYFDGFIL